MRKGSLPKYVAILLAGFMLGGLFQFPLGAVYGYVAALGLCLLLRRD